MRYTYDKAEQVIMWLGRETSDSHLAIELIQELKMEKISKVSVLDSLQDIRKREKWMAFMKLCARKYWSRLWILQEVASVPKNVVYIGKQSASWDDIGSLAATITNDLRSAWSSFGFMRKRIFRLVDIESLYGLYSMSRRGEYPKLGHLLRITRRHKCREPRDKVYGLIALADDCRDGNFVVDYRLPVAEVFLQGVQFAIGNVRKLDIVCEVQYLPSELDLPSWVPDWTMRQHMSGLSSRTGPNFLAAGHTEAEATYSSDGRAITITGCQLGRVEVLGERYSEPFTVPPFTAQMKETITQWLKLALDCNSKISSGAHNPSWEFKRIDSLWRTLIGNRIKGLEKIDPDRCRKMFDVARGAVPLPVSNSAVGADVAFHDFVSPLAFEMNSNIFNRRFFTSGHELMGVAPPMTQVGDYIVILLGCDRPVILNQEDERWKLQGDAYVHGFMNGEAVKLWESGKLALQKFTIH
jgi:hypothetical protein